MSKVLWKLLNQSQLLRLLSFNETVTIMLHHFGGFNLLCDNYFVFRLRCDRFAYDLWHWVPLHMVRFQRVWPARLLSKWVTFLSFELGGGLLNRKRSIVQLSLLKLLLVAVDTLICVVVECLVEFQFLQVFLVLYLHVCRNLIFFFLLLLLCDGFRLVLVVTRLNVLLGLVNVSGLSERVWAVNCADEWDSL